MPWRPRDAITPHGELCLLEDEGGVFIWISYNVFVRTFWLSMHLPYACRDSGACCSSGWDIPLEARRVAAVRILRPDGAWLKPFAHAPSDIAGVLAQGDDGRCVFRDGRCEIHRALGHGALPSACQHFPREVLLDPRGAFVTLSHYCPTAADLLFSHRGRVEIVEGPPALPDGEPEGLDARDVLPPLLTENVLTDFASYTAWETHLVHVLTSAGGGPAREALDTLHHDLALLQRWRPGGESLEEAVRQLRCDRTTGDATSHVSDDAVIRRYLAARAFASWMPYEAGGLNANLNSLEDALSVVNHYRRRFSLRESIRQADLQLVHLTPRHELATRYRTRPPRGHGRSSRPPAAP